MTVVNVINTGHEERQVKLPAGSLVAYPPYFLHRVAPVTRGVCVWPPSPGSKAWCATPNNVVC